MIDMLERTVATIAERDHVETLFFRQGQISGRRKNKSLNVYIFQGIAATAGFLDVDHVNAELSKHGIG
ncbi:MAG: hypothetical protein WBV91_01675 [Desulfobacterales bacterium]